MLLVLRLILNELNCMNYQETVTTPLIPCMNGYHFCCLLIIQYKKNCPQCRSGKIFHRKFKPQMIECIHEGSSKYYLNGPLIYRKQCRTLDFQNISVSWVYGLSTYESSVYNI
jgi:hypothetical protein